MQIPNAWKAVPHTLVFESALAFAEKLKRSNNADELIRSLFHGQDYGDIKTIFKNNKIRLLVQRVS